MDLNLSKSVMDLMFGGRLFHNFGAIFFKSSITKILGWISYVFHREDFFDCDLRFRLG